MLIALLASLPLVGAIAFVATGQARRLWWAFRERRSVDMHPGRMLRSAIRELGGIAVAASWHLRAFFADGLRRPTQVTGRTVLCIHGFTQNGTNMWGVRRALERVGRPTRAVSLGRFGRPLESYVPRLVDALRDAEGEIDVVAHSMGGVILRMALHRHPELRAKIRHVVSLGSPHGGTAACDDLPQVWEVGGLSRRSTILARLPTVLAMLPHGRHTTVAGRHDAIVFPPETCHEPDSEAIELDAMGHVGLLTDPEAIAAVVSALDPLPSEVELPQVSATTV